MKKILSIALAFVLCLSFASVAFADAADELVHAGALPAESTAVAKITITGLHAGGNDDDSKLPSEYHVRVKWTIIDGVYNATATDGVGGFRNFAWDCDALQYTVTSNNSATGDIRTGNWSVAPSVAFEVTNASTPDLPIMVNTYISSTDWMGYLKNSIVAQYIEWGCKTVAPVQLANMGTGINSYEQNNGAASDNVETMSYTFDWDYDALNTLALANFMNGIGTADLTTTFVVTISAN